jgi:hypothetical protein
MLVVTEELCTNAVTMIPTASPANGSSSPLNSRSAAPCPAMPIALWNSSMAARNP